MSIEGEVHARLITVCFSIPTITSHPPQPDKMCYIQERTFTCGHTQKMLFMSCNFAKQLTPTVDRRAPTFCLEGLKVVQHITIDGACGAYRKYEVCNRLESRVLKPFFDRQAIVEAEFAAYAERFCNIRNCMNNGKRPIYNFQQIAKEGWDAKEQQEQQDMIWTKLLPESVDQFTAVFARACNEMMTVYALTLNTVLLKYFGRSIDHENLPPLTTQIEPGWDLQEYMIQGSGDTPLTNPDAMIFEQVLHQMRTKIQYSLEQLELQAVEACMDDVGWVLPNDKDARDMVEPMVYYRLVQPLARSGTDIRKDFIYPGGLNNSLVATVQQDNDVDVLDTAEW